MSTQQECEPKGWRIGEITAHDASVVIGLITYRNSAGLEKLISHIYAADIRNVTRIVVVDNDSAASSQLVVAGMAARSGSPALEYFLEPTPGIPFARNRIFVEALKSEFDYIAMLDDDEYPDPNWLVTLLDCAVEKGAHVASGRVIPVASGRLPVDVRMSDYEHITAFKRAGRDFVGATSNVLISRAVVDTFKGDWFSAEYAATGGSDTEFFSRVFDQGFAHLAVDDSIAYEDIPASRLGGDWLIMRAYRKGNSIARVRVSSANRAKETALEVVRIGGLLALCGVLTVAALSSSRRRLELKMILARIRGKWAAIRKIYFNEYDPSHYRAA